MKIKRFQAASMREAMKQVREAFSDDAVILESRRTAQGVEVVAATDYDSLSPAAAQLPLADVPAHTPASAPVADLQMGALQRELGEMKRLLETQLGGLLWNQSKGESPQRNLLFVRLCQLGIAPDHAHELIAALPEHCLDARADNAVLSSFAQQIPVLPHELHGSGGVIALVGPTGVGKTTTIAKLAARYAVQMDVRDIALVSTDHYRIGAQEQLFTYGRLLGIPVHTAHDEPALQALLARLANRKLVLIDTAGMAPQDRQLMAQLALFRPLAGKLRTYLTMTASVSPHDAEQVIRQFRSVPLAGCILTKLDEATRIGAALSAVVRHQLGLAWVCDGQRVPEDLQMPRADVLVRQALSLARQWPEAGDDRLLAHQYVLGLVAQKHASDLAAQSRSHNDAAAARLLLSQQDVRHASL
jgi:flagellar biosynthesis protein FlhF